MSQRFEGKNLDDALTAASQALGVERFQLTYHVLLEKRGFLGGVKRVVIEAEINEAAVVPAVQPAPIATPAPSAPPARRPEGGRSTGHGGRGGRGGRGGDRGGGGGGQRRGRGPRRERFEADLQPGDFEQHFDVEVPEQGEQSEAAKTVAEWCERVIALARLALELRTEENETQIIVRLYGRDMPRLTEQHGELLDAIQVLANKAFAGRKVEKDIELDCGAFKGKRIEQLEQTAREVADRVRRDGREQLLPAMTPIERRIIHLALAEDTEVATESRGDGFYKRVAIVPRESTAAPE
ncbi:MAG: R3H domain-containing nucleic acid-binding protein [Acidobacteriota bacterium]